MCAVAFALPADWDGIKLMALPGQHHKRTRLEAPFAKIGDVESLTIFDDVFVPNSRVFMNGLENEGVCRYAGYQMCIRDSCRALPFRERRRTPRWAGRRKRRR